MTVRTTTTLAVGVAGLVALAGCGSNDAADAVRTQASAAQQQRANLSPQAQQVLERAQALAGDVATTAQGYAAQQVTRQQAQSKLVTYRQRAADLARQAQDLPETSRSRGRLTRLTAQLQRTTQTLSAAVSGSGRDAALQSSVERLRATATSTYDQLRGKVPADARQRISDAMKALGA